MAARKPSPNEPEIVEMPGCRMAAVYAVGVPAEVFPQVLPVLYGAVYALKFQFKKTGGPAFTVGPLRARYPDAHLFPREQWTNVIGLPVPEEVESLPQKVGGPEVRLETWEYGTVAQVLFRGSYDEEGSAVSDLLEHITAEGYEIIGVHEEEYLTRPGATTPRTIIRYRVRRK